MKLNNMNKIVLEDSLVNSSEIIKTINESGIFKLDLENISKDIVINIEDNLSVTIVEINTKNIINTITYNIGINSKLNINVFDDSNDINRNITINLNGKNSDVKFNAGIISHDKNIYKLNVHHNASDTTSNTILHGVSYNDSKILIENNGYIPKGSSKSVLKQDNKIILMGNNNSKIDPNLYIDEYDVEASHGAYIGKFEDEVLFYLNSRGLDYDMSYNLLIKGFLLDEFYLDDEINEDILKIINKYWR